MILNILNTNYHLCTGECLEMVDILADVSRVAELFSCARLVHMVKNLQNGEAFINKSLQEQVLLERTYKVRDLLLRKAVLSGLWNVKVMHYFLLVRSVFTFAEDLLTLF